MRRYTLRGSKMRELLQEVIDLQKAWTANNTPEMKQRGLLIRRAIPDDLRSRGTAIRSTLGVVGEDTDAEGRDAMGLASRIPWVRWHSKSRSPSATQGWYVVYLFHPEGTGVSLCLSHGSTVHQDGALTQRSAKEVQALMTWAAGVVGSEFQGDPAVVPGIKLGTFKMARAYEATTLFSRFYASGSLPPDDQLERDLLRFMVPLRKLYLAQDRGAQPGAVSPELLAVREEIERVAAPLRKRSQGQGRGLSGPVRKLIELHAMDRARDWLQAGGFSFKDVSANDSCDFRAERDGEAWVIEVKGTTGGPGSILLTRNEVLLHRAAHPKNALLVVHGIELSEDQSAVSGGTLLAHAPWDIEKGRLRAICFEYRLG